MSENRFMGKHLGEGEGFWPISKMMKKKLHKVISKKTIFLRWKKIVIPQDCRRNLVFFKSHIRFNMVKVENYPCKKGLM